MREIRAAVNEGTLPTGCITEKINWVARNGFDKIGLWKNSIDNYLQSGKSITDLVANLKEHKLKVLELNYLGDWLFTQGSAKKKAFRYAEELLALARDINAEMLCTACFGEGLDVEIAKRNLQELSGMGRSYDIKIALEFLPYQSISTINTAWQLIKKTNCSNVGLLIDTFHFFMGGSSVNDLLNIPAERIFLIHLCDFPNISQEKLLQENKTAIEIDTISRQDNILKDFYVDDVPEWISLCVHNRIFPSKCGIFALNELVTMLQKIGYEGYYSLEVLNRKHFNMKNNDILIEGMQSILDLF